MRLYHERQSDRPGAIDARDEEECFSGGQRQIGVYLTTDPVAGPNAFVADVESATVDPYEVTGEATSSIRSFVVPGKIVATLGFRAVT